MKRKLTGILLAAVLAAGAISPMTVMADSQKVVTLGADLTEEQKNAVLKYFGIQGQNVQTLIITNQDERDHLGSYVPLEQIGTRTFSCALVNPTSSGGIQVKTANLNWVTGNMIATTLSTSGVTNCQVLAASPFEVSGTGALTGVIMAYETASGRTLDTQKKELATQELITTGTIANQVGQDTATGIVNEIKIQVIEGQVVDPVVVEEIVDEVVEQSSVSLSDEDRVMLEDLANKIAQQQYDYEQMKETLERVEQNTASAGNVNVNVNVENNNSQDNNQTNNNDQSTTQTNNNDQNSTNNSTNTSTQDNGQTVDVSNDSTSTSDAADSSEENIFVDAGDTTDLGTEVITTNSVDSSNLNEADLQNQAEAGAASDAAVDDSGITWTEDTFTFNGDENQPAGQPADSSADVPADVQTGEEFNFNTTDETILNIDGTNTEVYVDDTGAPVDVYTEPADGSGDVNTADTYTEDTYTEDPALQDTTAEDPAAQDVTAEDPYAETGEQTGEGQPEDAVGGENTEAAGPVVLTDECIGILPRNEERCTGIIRIALAGVNADTEASISGTLRITDEFGTENASIDLAETGKAACKELSDDVLDTFGWREKGFETGTEILVNLGDIFSDSGTYTVSAEGLTLNTADGRQVTADTFSRQIRVSKEGSMLLHLTDIKELTEGNTVSAEILMDGFTYTAASFYTDGNSATDSSEVSYGAGSFNLTFYGAGTTTVFVDFYAEDGTLIESVSFEIPVLAAEW